MPRVKLTELFVKRATAQSGAERTLYWDETLPGFGLVVTALGHKSFVAQYRASGISRRYTIKGTIPLTSARKHARTVLGEAAKGGDPLAERRRRDAEAQNTLRTIAEDYLAREAKSQRSFQQRRRELERYIYPRLGHRQIGSIRRSEIVRLLDQVEDKNGPVAAHHALAILRRVFNWHATRDDDFRSPIVRGMGRVNAKERERTRVLSDDELRVVWRAAGAAGMPYGYLVRFILLTATRLNEAARMRRSELSKDGAEWMIPAARHKSKRDLLLPLSKAAQGLLSSVPLIEPGDYVFTTNGATPISGFSKFKAAFDKRVLGELRKLDSDAQPLPHWTTHDLRRTARSLMSRAGVHEDHAERAIGHVIGGVRGVYDRHAYLDEKACAFEALAAQIERILNPQANVVPLEAKQAKLDTARLG